MNHKIWRLSNNGTCTWGPGYQFAFIGGEAMTMTTVVAVPNTPPGATADLLVAMAAPATPGDHVGQWRLRSPVTFFGHTVIVKIVVPGAAPSPAPSCCSGSPNIPSFSASPATISPGGSSALSWGLVTNAESVEIDQGIGGVATPGSVSVSPASTTTYTLTARCGANTKTAQVTVVVQAGGLADLYVSEFSLTPDPPRKSQVTQVRIGIYNQGNAAAGSFKVQWFPGSSYPSPACSWTVTSMAARGGQILTCEAPANTWGSWYASIVTRVKVDPENNVLESDKGNNIYDKTIRVDP